MRDFIRSLTFKKKSPWVLLIALPILFCLMVLCAILSAIVPDLNEVPTSFVAFCIVFVGAITFYSYFIYYILPKINYKKVKNITGERDSILTFKEDRFFVLETDIRTKLEKELFYSEIFQVIETKKYIFVYENKGIAHPVDKRNLTENEVNFIRQSIQKYINKNYIYSAI